MTAVAGSGGRIQYDDNRVVRTAIAASLIFHAAVLFGVNLMKAPAKKETPVPGTIVARLAQPRAAVAAAPPAQEAPKPQVEVPPPPPPPPKPSALPRLAPVTRDAPVTKAVAPAAPATPSPAVPRSAEPATAVTAAPPPPTAVAPAATAAPAATVGAPATPSPAAESADPGTLSQYRLAIMGAARRYKKYPRVAMDNNWEGKVEVRMVIGANGMIASISVRNGTGHEILDQQALDMIRKAKPLAPIPAALRGKEFTVDLPVIFSLKDEAG
jgi:protein TonB